MSRARPPISPARETATQLLHRLTSCTWPWYERSHEDPELIWSPPVDDPRVVTTFEPNDLGRFPWFHKRYGPGPPSFSLPRDLPTTDADALTVLAGSARVAPAAVDLDLLARLLHLSAGVVRTMERPYATWLFRAAGSAGGRFPLEVYVAVPDGIDHLPTGVHWYHPAAHALLRIGPPPAGEAPTIVVTGVPWRTGWRYRERGYRHVYWDAGTMLSQLLAAADSSGIPASLVTRFPDRTVTDLVGADGVSEWPVAIVALGDGAPAIDPRGPAADGSVDADPVEFPLVTSAQRAGDGAELGAVWSRGASVDVPDLAGRPLEAVVLARGSQRRMDPDRGLRATLMRSAMAVSMRGIDLPHRVVVHDVIGLDPGVFRWPDLDEPARRVDLRGEMYRICMEQALARDAAFVAVAAVDLTALDDRGYRDAHLAGGLVEGRLHLAAYGLGAGASGMTFIDGEMSALLGDHLSGVLCTCVGTPAYRSATGGTPGAPTAVRKVSEG